MKLKAKDKKSFPLSFSPFLIISLLPLLAGTCHRHPKKIKKKEFTQRTLTHSLFFLSRNRSGSVPEIDK
ncbi:hypothetical protein RIF29_20990 [Crotalaria pallida]|uniref:Uncharacterized protein n=1 Tax=Crotalaria pallida TaxID=3830 RepID=A0AAN9FAP6_CROPI